MTDEELAKFMGIAGHPKAAAVIAKVTPAERATYEKMAAVELEVRLWLDGLGPKPKGVMIDLDRGRGLPRYYPIPGTDRVLKVKP